MSEQRDYDEDPYTTEEARMEQEDDEGKQKKYDYVGAIMAYEQGDLDIEETIRLFQYLKDTGIVNSLQGHYGRTLRNLVIGGYVY